jgi:hypothetical protein
MKKSIWVKGKTEYVASYKLAGKDRVFQLEPVRSGRIYTFESWQAAVKSGFKKAHS